MERPHEYIRRIATSLPMAERGRMEEIAQVLETLGRPHYLPAGDVTYALSAALAARGYLLAPGDRVCVAEPWDRPSARPVEP